MHEGGRDVPAADTLQAVAAPVEDSGAEDGVPSLAQPAVRLRAREAAASSARTAILFFIIQATPFRWSSDKAGAFDTFREIALENDIENQGRQDHQQAAGRKQHRKLVGIQLLPAALLSTIFRLDRRSGSV